MSTLWTLRAGRQLCVQVQVIGDHVCRAEPALCHLAAGGSVQVGGSEQPCGEILCRILDEAGPTVIETRVPLLLALIMALAVIAFVIWWDCD